VVLVDLGPVRVIQLMDGEARLQSVVEPHVVDRLVDGLLDQQRSHRRQRCDAAPMPTFRPQTPNLAPFQKLG
jgi:hypothetical protein